MARVTVQLLRGDLAPVAYEQLEPPLPLMDRPDGDREVGTVLRTWLVADEETGEDVLMAELEVPDDLVPPVVLGGPPFCAPRSLTRIFQTFRVG